MNYSGATRCTGTLLRCYYFMWILLRLTFIAIELFMITQSSFLNTVILHESPLALLDDINAIAHYSAKQTMSSR